MNSEKLKVSGHIAIRDKDGARRVKNLVVSAGINGIAARMVSDAAPKITHMALGTGTASAAAGNTTLNSELIRVAIDSAVQLPNGVQYTATFPPGAATITEAGMFTGAIGGNMWCRAVFPVYNKSAGDEVSFVWNVELDHG